MQEKVSAEEILQFVREEYLDPGQHIDASTSLIRSGIVDSFSMAGLRAWLEERSGKAIPDSAATVEAFDSADSILRLLDSLP